jgi:hypothetical protein
MGQKFILTGINSATKDLLGTATTGSGTIETEAIQVDVAKFPTKGVLLP